MSEPFEYDVFLSHSSRDKYQVELLAKRLQHEAGLRPFLDKWHLTPGLLWQQELEEALERSATVAVFFGPDPEGPWRHQEMQLALNRAVQSRDDYRVIPVLLPGADVGEISGFIKLRTWVDFRQGIESDEIFRRLVAAIKGEAIVDDYSLPDEPAPYRGLLSFQPEHSRFFFGREADRQRLLQKLSKYNFVCLLGASGCGKSSLVRAGLLPSLAEGALPGSRRWRSIIVTPGRSPLRSLAEQISTLASPAERLDVFDSIHGRLANRPDTLRTAVRTLLAGNGEAAFLLIDQFEELFTHYDKEQQNSQAATQSFIANIVDAAQEGEGSIRVVITLRADFMSHALAYPGLRLLLEDGQVLLGELGEAELRDAIIRPAQSVGAFLERGLLGLILRDVVRQPGALPLLQHALYELWLARRGPWLTLDAYESSGGVSGSLQRRAESCFGALTPLQQRLARNIFLRLTILSSEAFAIKRRAWLAELYPAGAPPGQVNAVLQVLSGPSARLITVDEKTAEVSHEAIIREWPRLLSWLEEDRDFLWWRQRLQAGLNQWLETGRNEGALLRGAPLEAAQRWEHQRADDLTDDEREFVKVSVAALNAEQQRWQALYGLAQARHLAGVAKEVLDGTGTGLVRSALLATESLKLTRVLENDTIARQTLALLPKKVAEVRHKHQVSEVAFSPDGKTVATGSMYRVGDVGDVRLWDVETGKLRAKIANKDGLSGLAFSPDGRLIAMSNWDGPTRLYDAATGKELRSLKSGYSARSVAFSPDGRLLAVAVGDCKIRVFNLEGRRAAVTIKLDGGPYEIAFSGDGRFLAAATQTQDVSVWEAATGKLFAKFNIGELLISVAFGPGSKLLATAGHDKLARIWDLTTKKEKMRFRHDEWLNVVAFSPDGAWLATGHDQTVHLWSIRKRRKAATMRHEGDRAANGINSIRFSPNSRQLVSISWDGTARVWEVPSGVEHKRVVHEEFVRAVAFSPDGRRVVTGSEDRTAKVWEVNDGLDLIRMAHDDLVNATAFSRDLSLLATAQRGGRTTRVWSVATGDEVARLPHHGNMELAFSSDGSRLITTGFDTTRLWDTAAWQEIPLRSKASKLYGASIDEGHRWLAAVPEKDEAAPLIFDLESGDVLGALKHDKNAFPLVFSPKGDMIATIEGEESLCVWEPKSFERVFRVATGVEYHARLYWSPDARWIVTSPYSHWVSIWDSRSGRKLADITHGNTSIYAVAFSPDSEHLVTGGDDGTVRVWEVRSQKEIMWMSHAEGSRVMAAAFSDDGRWLATGASDVRLWETSTGKEFARIGTSADDILFTPDGDWLVVKVFLAIGRLWPLSKKFLINETCARLPRNLSPTEWRKYVGPEVPYVVTCPGLPVPKNGLDA